jgi:homocysteine S-methyltransferase
MPPSPSEPQILLLDGGLGTLLADQFAVKFDDSTPLWSSQLLLSSPSTLLSAQKAFAQAGADILLTATYQASFEGFERCGVQDDEAGEKMREAVGIARAAFAETGKRDGKIALSLGAYGATMVPSQEYSGAYDEVHKNIEGLREWHLKRVRSFYSTWEEIEYVAFETLPLATEVLAVRKVMGIIQSEVGKKGFWISCVFPGKENRLPDGSDVREVLRAMLGKSEGAVVPMGIGINCTKVGKLEGLIEEFEKAIRELVQEEEVVGWPALVVYPDGTNGEEYNTTTKEWEKREEQGEHSVSGLLQLGLVY